MFFYVFLRSRYSNFERLHRHLKEIPNYTLHLPPKRIFSSSTEDSFVHQRCIQLDKYLQVFPHIHRYSPATDLYSFSNYSYTPYVQDLLSIANVAEQHEVWDFLSASSKVHNLFKFQDKVSCLLVVICSFLF